MHAEPAASTPQPPAAPRSAAVLHGHVDVAAMEQLAERLLARTPGTYELHVKPLVDRMVAAVALVVLSPVLLAVALAVWYSVGRPILYGQRRAGLGGRPFTMLKFRSMETDRRDDEDDERDRRHPRPQSWPWRERRIADRRVTHKTAADPRHTPVGRLLRRTSLDELPQLLNVLRGDMSLVGPRPELYGLTAGYAPWQQARHLVRPGITGLWQTTRRGDGLLLHECIDLDLRYVERLSAARDLAILLRTPFALLRTRDVI